MKTDTLDLPFLAKLQMKLLGIYDNFLPGLVATAVPQGIGLLAIIASGGWMSWATAFFGMVSAAVLALLGLRKFALMLMHDWAAFKKGKLPKVDPSEK